MELSARYRGAMLGLAVGDALGAPVESLKAGHIRQLYGEIVTYVDPAVAWQDKPRFWRMPGLYSDDTQQALALADALVRCRGFDARYFIKLLADLARAETGGHFGAHRGTGGNFRATVRALMEGVEPDRASRPSAGIGAMMRAAPCGLYFADDPEAALRGAIAQGLVTHNDPRSLVMAAVAADAVNQAVTGAWDRSGPAERMRALATAAAAAERMVEKEFIARLPVATLDRIGMAAAAVAMLPRLLELPEEGMAFKQIVAEANRQFPEHKITEPGQGFVMAAGMSALFMALAANNYEDAVKTAVHLGKDTDTMAAIVGGICGARFGEDAVPEGWRKGLVNAEQVALRGEALLAREAAGLGLKDLVAMEAELTRKEVAAREAFILKVAPKFEGPKPPARPAAKAPPPDPESEAGKQLQRDRHQKKQKHKREKSPWKR